VNANQADVAVHTMCRVLKVSASGYYAWHERPPCQRALDDAVLTERIRAIHAESDATDGMPRVREELIEQGTRISRKRIARLMRRAGLHGVSRRRGFVVTTRRDASSKAAPDLVKREFVASGPNQLWVADMTYVPTWAGFIFLAVVLDVGSRRIVGWAIGEQMTADLVLAALNMALQRRRPHRGAIHDRSAQPAHQDRGPPGVVHLHRGLVQPTPTPLRARLPLTGELRKELQRRTERTTSAPATRDAHRAARRGQPCAVPADQRLRIKPQTVRESGSSPLLV
jgi:transposase InsO family protein